MRCVLSGVAVLFTLTGSPAFAYSHGSYYRSSDGSFVHSPYRTTHHVGGEMAVCRDGSHSVSHQRRGTCSRHGGVAHWG